MDSEELMKLRFQKIPTNKTKYWKVFSFKVSA